MRTNLEYTCAQCHLPFTRSRKDGRRENPKYCSKACYSLCFNLTVKVPCGHCGAQVVRQRRYITLSKSGHVFCDRSCSASYNNTHKTVGYRRSKLEIWLESQIPSLFPDLEFTFNKKDAIDSELDIYLPSLKLAFELNGIYHYEPIYGSDKLDQIKNNDHRKFQACTERGIELCIVDTSSHTYVTPKTSQKYLTIISSVINQRLSRDLAALKGVSD